MISHAQEFGTHAWIVKSTDFPYFMDITYQSNFFGEIWLFNNDLRVITEDESFRELYYNRIAGSLSSHIDAVKILINKKQENKVFGENNKILHSKLLENLIEIAKKPGGKERLSTFYFGKMSDIEIPELESHATHTIVFYTLRDSLYSNPGVVMVRHNIFPFRAEGEDARYAVVWQLRWNERLRERLSRAFQNCYENPENFSHIEVDEKTLELGLVQGWSKETVKKKKERKLQRCCGLALGDDVDIAILASQDCELEPLEEHLLDHQQIPIGSDNYRYSIIQKRHVGEKKILLAVIGEGNLAAVARTWDIIEKWNPKHIILMGVAGGDPNDKNVELGDIVIGEMVVGYDHGEIRDDGFSPVATRWDADHTLFQAASRLARHWSLPESECWPIREFNVSDVKVHSFPIASGSKLIVSPEFFKDQIQDGIVIHKLGFLYVSLLEFCTCHSLRDVQSLLVKQTPHHYGTAIQLIFLERF